MKYLAVFLVASFGAVVGAGLVRLAMDPVPANPPAARESASRAELRELGDCIAALERLGSTSVSAGSADASAANPSREELIDEARRAARAVATEVAQLAQDGGDSVVEREAALARAIEQVHAAHEDTRRNGIRRLRGMFASDASAEVIPSLSDDSALVRLEAATYFEYLWDPAALEPLVDLLYGRDEAVAEQALDALCKSGQEEAIIKLQDYFLSGPVLELAFEAGKALEENRRTAAVPEGVQRFRDASGSSDTDERRLGLAGLARWSDAATEEWRVRALASDADDSVRTEARRTLAAWGLEGAP